MLGVFIACSWWLYVDAVKATTESKQISAIQTVGVADSDKAVLSLTLSDGSNVQYLVKALDSHRLGELSQTSSPTEDSSALGAGELGNGRQRRRCRRAARDHFENVEEHAR